MKQSWIVLFYLLGLVPLSYGQEVHLDVSNQPLNTVLTEMRDQFNVQVSFNDRLLSGFRVTVSKSFASPELAISHLVKELPLAYEKKGEVFIIYRKPTSTTKKEHRLSGQITDARSGEALPFSHVKINDVTMATDLLGNFNYLSESDSVFDVKASHLGYYVLDTTFIAGTSLHIKLIPSSIGLNEVVVKNSYIDKSTRIGSRPGLMKMNHKLATFLPGFGDNSVFNLLRLMPGILASGESTNDLVIWGSYAGQSQVLFDGFTIFGLKNFNDNISSFNPLMAKDIEVMKGGFDARYGERVGGIVNITGKNGNILRPSFSVTLNNMTLNGLVEIPIAKKASVVFSIRHTWYNLYNPGDINSNLRRNNDSDTANDINVVPDYVFRDMNFKYTQHIGENDLFYFSMYGGNDKFSYAINKPIAQWTVTKNTAETNSQLGGALFYGKTWKSGNTSNFIVSYSGIVARYSDDYQVIRTKQDITTEHRKLDTKNLMDEFAVRVDNRFTLNTHNILEFGGGLYVNSVELVEDTFNITVAEYNEKARRIYGMVQDNIAIGKLTVLKIGSRFTYATNLQKWFAEPRISITVQANKYWKLNVAWGLYDQFITKSSIVDELGNYRYLWSISNNEDIPVVMASHFVTGITLNKRGWTVSLEPYYKKVKGITRYFFSELHQWQGVLTGESMMYGIDFFLQKDLKKHSVWLAYSLGKVAERWPELPNKNYRPAPQDQKHELKLAILLNFDPFYFSSNFVYGSGFPGIPQSANTTAVDLSYSRWDASFIYKFLNRRMVGEVGLSLLNILNTENIKYANFERIPANQTHSINIYAEAIPFTPALYLKFSM